MNGKGHMRRPFDRNKFDGNYDEAFGRTSKQGRSLDLSRLQSDIFILIRDNGYNTVRSLKSVIKMDATSQEISTALQLLQEKGSVRFSYATRTWVLNPKEKMNE